MSPRPICQACMWPVNNVSNTWYAGMLLCQNFEYILHKVNPMLKRLNKILTFLHSQFMYRYLLSQHVRERSIHTITFKRNKFEGITRVRESQTLWNLNFRTSVTYYSLNCKTIFISVLVKQPLKRFKRLWIHWWDTLMSYLISSGKQFWDILKQ